MGVLLATATPCAVRAQSPDGVGKPSDTSVAMQQQRLAQLFQERLPDAPPETARRAAKEFLDHLRQTSPIAADQIAAGKMDEDELGSRLDVYLKDHPELAGRASPAEAEPPRQKVAALLVSEPIAGRTDAERLASADLFIQRLGELSETARVNLMAGRMPDDELQSRVKVFAADLRAQAAAVAVDPAVAAVPPIADAFVKANIGSAAERAGSVCYSGVVERGATKRQFSMFKKRPNLVRIHIVVDGIVVGMIGFDGSSAWRQDKGQPAIPVVGSDADEIKAAARFDDPLVNYRERGSDVRLEDKKDDGLLRLHIREADHTEMVETLDPKTYSEVSLQTRPPGGSWSELRFSDYRKIGTLRVSYAQEQWADGKLSSVTRITAVTLDPGLLDEFFSMPKSSKIGYMDYMNALSIVQAELKRSGGSGPSKEKATP